MYIGNGSICHIGNKSWLALVVAALIHAHRNKSTQSQAISDTEACTLPISHSKDKDIISHKAVTKHRLVSPL